MYYEFVTYDVTTRGIKLPCLTIKGVAAIIKEVPPSISFVRRYINGVNVPLNEEETAIINIACHEQN